mmetsp:Transcript_75402/g.157170  ORF Transcript_75402/g.157170 Transcript_75402/m.157170 type:complete len:705 (+) Transcript_75402:181-2295(+)
MPKALPNRTIFSPNRPRCAVDGGFAERGKVHACAFAPICLRRLASNTRFPKASIGIQRTPQNLRKTMENSGLLMPRWGRDTIGPRLRAEDAAIERLAVASLWHGGGFHGNATWIARAGGGLNILHRCGGNGSCGGHVHGRRGGDSGGDRGNRAVARLRGDLLHLGHAHGGQDRNFGGHDALGDAAFRALDLIGVDGKLARADDDRVVLGSLDGVLVALYDLLSSDRSLVLDASLDDSLRVVLGSLLRDHFVGDDLWDLHGSLLHERLRDLHHLLNDFGFDDLGDLLGDFPDLVQGNLLDDLSDLDLRDLGQAFLVEDLRNLDDLLLLLNRPNRHLFLDDFDVGLRHLDHDIDGLDDGNLDGDLLHERFGNLFDGLPRLQVIHGHFLSHHLHHGFGDLRDGFDVHDLVHLDWPFFIDDLRHFHNLFDVLDYLLGDPLVDVLNLRFGHLFDDLAGLDRWNLDDPLLIHNLGNFDDFLDVLDFHFGHLSLRDLNFVPRNLLNDLDGVELFDLDDAFLDGDLGYLHNLLDLVHHNLFDGFLNEFDDALGDLLDKLLDLHAGHLHQLFGDHHMRDFHDAFAVLGLWVNDLLLHFFGDRFGDLLKHLDLVNLRHFLQNLHGERLWNLDLNRNKLVHRTRHLFRDLLHVDTWDLFCQVRVLNFRHLDHLLLVEYGWHFDDLFFDLHLGNLPHDLADHRSRSNDGAAHRASD